MLTLYRTFITACIASISAASAADVVELGPSKDNTLCETRDGSTSLALSQWVFAGRVGNHGGNAKLRRGLMRFDIAGAIPAGSTITSVDLKVVCMMTNTGPHPVELHRALADWGEGTSDAPGGGGGPSTPGDATWLHTFWPDQFWTEVGGDFEPEASAVCEIATPGDYQWLSTPALVADVQTWLDDPAQNFGWLIRGDEPYIQSVKALASRENRVIEARPKLIVHYGAPPPIVGDLDGDRDVDAADLAALLGQWGPCAEPTERAADFDEDLSVGPADLAVLLGAWTG